MKSLGAKWPSPGAGGNIEREGLVINTFAGDTAGLLEAVAELSARVQQASADYIHTGTVLNLSDCRQNGNGEQLAWSFDLGLKELCLLGAITQAPLALRGATDKGKTALAERILSGLFGRQGCGWWRLEVNRGMSIDDLIDLDVKKLSESKLSAAISSATWTSLPAILLDEVNRSHAKLINLLLHIVDGSGLNVRGDLSIPIGMPYRIGPVQKRYSFALVTANEVGADTPGTYEEDAALIRRIVLSHSLDQTPVTCRDVVQLVSGLGRRAKKPLPACESALESVVRVYESLPEIRFSALAQLLLLYFWGLGTCIRTRSGRIRRELMPGLCAQCHLSKSHRFCGKVDGLTEGLLLWTREVAFGLAAIRGAKVLAQVRRECLEGGQATMQKFLGSSASGEQLYGEFARLYLQDFAVQGEDVVGAYKLIAPSHLWMDREFIAREPAYEKSPVHAFGDVAFWSWDRLRKLLTEHETLITRLAENGDIAPEQQAEVESVLITKDAAMLAVISALREREIKLSFRKARPGNGAVPAGANPPIVP